MTKRFEVTFKVDSGEENVAPPGKTSDDSEVII